MKRLNLFIISTALLFSSYSWAQHTQTDQYLTSKYNCLTSTSQNALQLGDSIAHGSNLTRQYEIILQHRELFSDPNYFVEPIHLAYGLYIIAERIGIAEARKKQDWLFPYIPIDIRDKITATIYKKYSTNYLQKCFLAQQTYSNENPDDPNIPSYLYMDWD